MCNVYAPPPPQQSGDSTQMELWGSYVAPLKPGPYMKGDGELVVGQWGMIPPDAKTRTPWGATNNARRETLAVRATYKGPWLNGQRCLIPAVSFQEPYYPENDPKAKSIAWKFERADGENWALAGLWAEWTDPVSGEVVPSYTMITQNCDGHPLLGLMHKPVVDKKTGLVLPIDQQDKRAVVPIERDKWDEWLHGTIEQAEALIQLPPLEIFRHGAVDPYKNIPLPGPARQYQITNGPASLF